MVAFHSPARDVVVPPLIASYCEQITLYRIAGNFVGLSFRYQALKAYFLGLIFVMRPEHIFIIIIVAYYEDFRGLIFCFEALRNENKTQQKFPTIRYVC